MAAMHVFTQQANKQAQQGIRPFDMGRDLRPVAKLIAESFADELDANGEAALRELHILSYMSGLIRLLNRSTGDFQDVFNGFVWLEHGKVVGNVTVQRAGRHSGRWQIANVAVAPPYRGRGISRELMNAALEYIEESGGYWAVLQVRADNAVARGLYERMGFENMGGTTELWAPRVPGGVGFPSIPGLQPFKAHHSRLLYDLVSSQYSAETQWWRAIRHSDFHVTIEQRLGEWLSRVLGRQQVYRMAVRDFKNRFEAALILTARRWQGTHELQLWARAEAQERYEPRMAQWAMATLQRYPAWPVKTTLGTNQAAARQALETYGFEASHTLLTMRRRMRH